MKNYLLAACLMLSLISCSTDDNTIPEPEENFFALTVGNSWVYEYFLRQNQVTAIYNNTGVVDSVKIIGTEIIDGSEFYTYRIRTSGNDNNTSYYPPNGERLEYFRDSLGYFINQNGNILFSREDDQELFLYDGSLYPVYTKRGENSEVISTVAGEFECEYMEVYARDPQTGEVMPGRDKKYYADGIGNILSTTSFVSSPIPLTERRLKSYEVP